MNFPTAKRDLLIIGLLVSLVTLGGASRLNAQIQVTFKLDKKIYMAHEAISGRLRITNRAGRDMVLEGRNGASWLDFQVTDAAGNLISPVQGKPGLESVMIRAGQVLDRKIYVNRRYPMGQTGIYRVRVNVFFAPLNQYFRTKIESLQITKGRKFWAQVVGVPAGYEQEGSYRKYEVLRFDYRGRKEIYFRLSRADSGMVIKTYSLGKLLMVTDPQMGVDVDNRLHVLHMGAPQAYAHTIIDVEGKAEPQEFFFAEGENRPRLVRASGGNVVVEGGIAADQKDTVYEKNEFHKLSEVPPGMPLN
ncbi:MAG: hypothetical protein GXP30_01315 [Verrucomicrobia bacterium]|nr:hypothetical protein [Verrucomicrobiota bacterium]